MANDDDILVAVHHTFFFQKACNASANLFTSLSAGEQHKETVFVYNTCMPKTALSLTSKEIAAYRRASALVKPKKRGSVRARRTRAWQVARKAAKILRTEFGVQKMMVFGSLLHPALFHERSDVDLAVWGLSGRSYYQAVSVLLDIEPSISVDLIAFEDARPALQTVILREGQEL